MTLSLVQQILRSCLLGLTAYLSCCQLSFAQLQPSFAQEITVAGAWSQANSIIYCPACLLPPQSRLEYAQQCEQDVGYIPDYNCMTGTEIPITKNGIKQTAPVLDNSCDKPVKLGLSNEGQCVPYTRLVDLSPANNPDVTIMAICRKYHALNGANDTRFNDLAMIAHNKKTGATCFFQSPVDQATPLEGTTVPSPMSSSAKAKNYWLEPAASGQNGVVQYQSPGGISCTNCHDADPFILSPWMQQVAKLNKWNPNGKYIVDQHGLFSPLASRPWVTAGLTINAAPQADKCTQCHRIGGSSINVIANGPGGLHAANGFPDFHGWMPFGNTDSADWWPYIYNEAVFELTNCLDVSNPGAGCNAVRAGTIK